MGHTGPATGYAHIAGPTVGGVSTSPRSPLALAALATVAIPGLDVVATRPPRHATADFDVTSLMDSTGRRWTVRAPRSAVAGAALEGEVELLAVLAGAVDDELLPFDVPRPAGFATLPEGGRAMVHRELRGDELDVPALTQALAGRLGQALARIHDLEPDVVADAGLPVYDAESYRTRRLAELDESARTGHVPTGLLRRWEHALEDVRLWKFIATPVHGDLAGEHILIAEEEVSAVLDWADARVADPADDLAWLVAAADPETGETILESYRQARADRADEFLAARTLLASELALPRWLMHGVRTRDNSIIDDAIEMLTDLDRAVADADPIGQVPPVSTDWVTGPVPLRTSAVGAPVEDDGEGQGQHDGTGPVPTSGSETFSPAGAELLTPAGTGGAYQRAGVDDPTIEGVIAVDGAPAGEDDTAAGKDDVEPIEGPDDDRVAGQHDAGQHDGDDNPTAQLPSA